MLRRSWLFTPGTRADRFDRAAAAGADVLIIDLEDAVALAEKPAARANAIQFCRECSGTIQHAIRVNAIDSRAGLADIEALLGHAPALDFVILPKVESAAHLRILDALLTEAGLPARLVALVETSRGVAAVEDIAAATARLAGVMFGAADFAADLGASADWAALLYARGKLVTACAMAGIAAIDAPFFAIDDAGGLREEAAAAAALGFAGKAAIHPAQVAAINAGFTPSAGALETARRILAACETGVGQVDGRMVDAAMARQARRILSQEG
jgi:(S)-citramalyl-CoA lyase